MLQLMELEVFASTLKGRLEEAVETIGRLYNESLGTLVRVDMTDSLVEQTQVRWCQIQLKKGNHEGLSCK